MFKRVLLAMTFVVALGAASLGIGSKAMAYCNDGFAYTTAYPYTSTYVSYGPRVAYYPPVPIRSFPVVYRPVDVHHHHHDHHHSGLSISFGF